jgi:hypothetical protein
MAALLGAAQVSKPRPWKAVALAGSLGTAAADGAARADEAFVRGRSGRGRWALAKIRSITCGRVPNVAVMRIRWDTTVIRLATLFSTETGAAAREAGAMSIASVVPTSKLGHS